MRRYSLPYLLGRSFKGFSRNGLMSFASVLILTSCLLISGCFGLLIYNLYVNLNDLDELNEIVCICRYKDFEKSELDALYDRLCKLENVEEVQYTSRAEALEKMREKYAEHPQILERFADDNNPFPDVYTIKYSGSEAEATDLLFALRNSKQFPEFKSVEDRIETANTLEKLKNTVLWIFIGFMLVLVFISVVIIMNTVRMAITARADEIEVMRYIGATGWFISFPFIFETFFTGLISALIAFGAQILIYDKTLQIISTDASVSGLIRFVPFSEVWYFVLGSFIVLSLLTCYIGSKISLYKHIKV